MTSSKCFMNSDELYHFGIKGMKWGVRRTPEQLGHKKKVSKRKQAKAEYKKNVAKIPNMSTQQIDDRIKRINKEHDLRMLEKRQYMETSGSKKKALATLGVGAMAAYLMSKANSPIRRILGNSGNAAATVVATGTLVYLGKEIVEDMFGEEATRDIFIKKK